MGDPFYSLHCVAGVEDGQAFRDVYLLEPQFCGGEKYVIARLYPEAVLDAKVEEPRLAETLPSSVREFLRWADANTVVRKE